MLALFAICSESLRFRMPLWPLCLANVPSWKEKELATPGSLRSNRPVSFRVSSSEEGSGGTAFIPKDGVEPLSVRWVLKMVKSPGR